MSSTSIKLAGGVSSKDADAFAKEMQCDKELILSMKKNQKAKYSDFACYVRNHTPRPVRLRVPLGFLECQPRQSEADFKVLIAQNRAVVARREDETHAQAAQTPVHNDNVIVMQTPFLPDEVSAQGEPRPQKAAEAQEDYTAPKHTNSRPTREVD